MIHLLFGLFAWSILEYIVHRFWHVLIRNNFNNKLLIREIQHHEYYDGIKDVDERYKSWPLEVWLSVIGISIFYASVIGWGSGIYFIIGSMIGISIDDYLHRKMHDGNLNWKFFNNWHKNHHKTHKHNFGMPLSIIWDYIFKTNYK